MRTPLPPAVRWLYTHLLECGLLLTAVSLAAQLLAPVAVAWWLRPRPGYQGEFSAADDPRLVDGTLPYRMLLFLPKDYVASGPAQPLVVHLHGAGERGNDLAVVRRESLPRRIDEGFHLPAVVASPQCPPGHSWDSQQVMAVIDHLQREFNIDSRRIYLTGYSMGGYGVWKTAALNPEQFAAIVPICGGGETDWATQLSRIPVWAFHGQRDESVAVTETTKMIDAIELAGGTPQLTVYPEGRHNVWGDVYQDNTLFTWLLSHQLPDTAAANALARP